MKKRVVIISIMLVILLSNFVSARELNISSSYPLKIETYIAGKNQLTHPSVISFDEPWHGYKYWMTYTPYPYANGEEENPCITVSNDMYYWTTPVGLANPIADNEEVGTNELKDSHILYREDLDRIEVWYLGRISENISGGEYNPDQLLLFRKYSYDGVEWSKYEVMKEIDYLSPSIIWKDNKYQLWSIGFDTYNTTGKIQICESVNGYEWTNENYCTIDENSDNKIWHGSVWYNDKNNLYEMVYIDDSMNSTDVLYCTSQDGINFTNKQSILKLSDNWDKFYRPFLFEDNNIYYLLYGVVSSNNEWYISMNTGHEISDLLPFTSEDVKKMIDIEYLELNVSSLTKLKNHINISKNYIRYEIYCIPFLMIIIMMVFKSKFDIKKTMFINILIIIGYLLLRKLIYFSLPCIIATIFMFISESSMMFVLLFFYKHHVIQK